MSLIERFRANIKEQQLFSAKDKLLLAVSGGVDSVVLCELCKQAGYDFIIAHCNFKLRGEESDRDEHFVVNLAKKYGVDVHSKQFDTEKYAAEKKLSIQEAARELRYNWFAELVASLPTRHSPSPTRLLTAHHADDNNETLLMNFFRGTGLHGLTGIPVSGDHIRRPLLDITKEEVVAFARENQLEFVEDSSNSSSKYTRNYFRNELIPAIGEVYPQVKQNLQGNISRFKEIEKLYRLSVGGLIKKLCRVRGTEIHIPVKQLMSYDNKALIYELIAAYGFQEKQIEELIKLAASDSGKYIQSPDNAYRVIKHRHWFIISPVMTTESANIVIESSDKDINFALGTIRIETTINPSLRDTKQKPLIARHEAKTINLVAQLDLKKIIFPLLLRKHKTGDYFYPLGMKKKKKVSRFLIDQKLSKTEKEKTWVIESAQRIIWVVGHRIDERFKLTEQTKEVIGFRLSSAK